MRTLSLDQLKAFQGLFQNNLALRQAVMAAATPDDVAPIAGKFADHSRRQRLRLSGQKVGCVTLRKQHISGGYDCAGFRSM